MQTIMRPGDTRICHCDPLCPAHRLQHFLQPNQKDAPRQSDDA
jgi:hypothetical protein